MPAACATQHVWALDALYNSLALRATRAAPGVHTITIATQIAGAGVRGQTCSAKSFAAGNTMWRPQGDQRQSDSSSLAGSDGAPKLWLSGKSDPLRPTSKDKLDGTKKDPKYLSCLNDCVPRCQKDASKDRSDCFDECQDECCFTYQQCTYTIRS